MASDEKFAQRGTVSTGIWLCEIVRHTGQMFPSLHVLFGQVCCAGAVLKEHILHIWTIFSIIKIKEVQPPANVPMIAKAH